MTSNSNNINQLAGRGRSRKQHKKATRIPVSVYMIYMLVVILTMTGVTLSGYVSSAHGADVVRVAVMATDVKLTIADQIPGHPGSSTVIPVEITNKEDDTICEVSQNYTLKVQALTDNIPLEYGLYSNDKCTELLAKTTSEADDKLLKVSGMFEAATEKTDKYWINIVWPEKENQTSYAFEIDGFEIIIDAEQID